MRNTDFYQEDIQAPSYFSDLIIMCISKISECKEPWISDLIIKQEAICLDGYTKPWAFFAYLFFLNKIFKSENNTAQSVLVSNNSKTQTQ